MAKPEGMRFVGLNTPFPFMQATDVLEAYRDEDNTRTETLSTKPAVLINTGIVGDPFRLEFSLEFCPAYIGERRTRGGFINPFFPDNGHEWRGNDAAPLSATQRKRAARWGMPIDVALDPIFAGEEQLALHGVLIGPKSIDEYDPTLVDRFANLRLELQFPGGMSVRTPFQPERAGGELLPFADDGFYTPDRPKATRGLILPPNPGKLSRVKASIVPHRPQVAPPPRGIPA